MKQKYADSSKDCVDISLHDLNDDGFPKLLNLLPTPKSQWCMFCDEKYFDYPCCEMWIQCLVCDLWDYADCAISET